MSVGVSLGLNMTNFLVSLHTVPPLLACVGWDDATTTRQPIGKSVGEFELGAGCSMSWGGWVLVYERRKARWIRLAAASRHCMRWKNRGGEEDAFSF